MVCLSGLGMKIRTSNVLQMLVPPVNFLFGAGSSRIIHATCTFQLTNSQFGFQLRRRRETLRNVGTSGRSREDAQLPGSQLQERQVEKTFPTHWKGFFFLPLCLWRANSQKQTSDSSQTWAMIRLLRPILQSCVSRCLSYANERYAKLFFKDVSWGNGSGLPGRALL